MMPQGIRVRTLLPSIAALAVGFAIFFGGAWVIRHVLPIGVPRFGATFLLLAATLDLIRFIRTRVARTLSSREARPSA
jgi:hypothetical protein